MADSGVENINGQVDALLDTGKLRRVLAYLHSLDSATAVERLVAFYVEQHNSVMPHRLFDGRTPDEVHFGVATEMASELRERRRVARQERIATNRLITCDVTTPGAETITYPTLLDFPPRPSRRARYSRAGGWSGRSALLSEQGISCG